MAILRNREERVKRIQAARKTIRDSWRIMSKEIAEDCREVMDGRVLAKLNKGELSNGKRI